MENLRKKKSRVSDESKNNGTKVYKNEIEYKR